MYALLPLLRRVPVWAWVLVLALGWGAVQRHRATSAAEALARTQAAEAQAREAALVLRQQEIERRLIAAQENADAARQQTEQAVADATARAAAAERLLQRARAVAARAPASAASAAESGPPIDPAAGLLADVLGRCVAQLGLVADFADRAHIAGQACERAYDSLTPIAPIQPIAPLKEIRQ